ncbi:MAG: GHMP kinase [Solibacterales bacterium]|nr:GHMP kinase [Bryobacterales bacterium]|tara:strand:+ start:5955 stop:6947 length:993 start_codon:yes stop_codon:yes gene_type:complete
MIEARAYARVGLLGNPSDGYFGKTIAFVFQNFRARVLLRPSSRIEIRPSKEDSPVWDSLDEMRCVTRWRGYYGGIRIIQALVIRFTDYCLEKGITLADHNFTIEYESNIPQRLGLGGSSAIITATLRVLMKHFEIDIPLPMQANLVLETETEELGVTAGLQDRVAQAYEGLVFMDFDKKRMESDGYGRYEKLDPGLLPNVYVAYRSSMSEGTEVFHNNIRARYQSGETVVVEAMQAWAEMAEQGRKALVDGDMERLTCLINANFDLRSRIYRISPGNEEMIRVARQAGATAKFAGSGGAIVGTYNDDNHLQALTAELAEIGVVVIKPVVR